jgi:hypothetical protein
VTAHEVLMALHTRKERSTGATLTIGTAAELEVDPDGGKWVVLCEDHSTLLNVDTRAAAMSSSAVDFCDGCRDRERERSLTEWQTGYQSALADVLAEIELRGAEAGVEWIRNNRMYAASGIFRRALDDH